MSRSRPNRVLVTGGAGFIGSNFVRHVLDSDPEAEVVNLDLLTYAGQLSSLEDVSEEHGAEGDGRYFFVQGDVRDTGLLKSVLRGDAREGPAGGRSGRLAPPPDAVVHLAAESHVDRSLLAPRTFVETNVQGTVALMEACRLAAPGRLRILHVSTDEVYGNLEPGAAPFTEQSPLRPRSPYAASKAAAELMIGSYASWADLPAVIVRCSNTYGPHQYPEKLIPLMITRALQHRALPVYGDGRQRRDWLHVDDLVRALWRVLCDGRSGQTYNVGGGVERPNLEVVRSILDLLERPATLIEHVEDRPGHDARYALDIGKVGAELGWQPRVPFEAGLAHTVSWYVQNEDWWRPLIERAYRTAEELYLGSPFPK